MPQMTNSDTAWQMRKHSQATLSNTSQKLRTKSKICYAHVAHFIQYLDGLAKGDFLNLWKD
jgi:hypothetical protein